MLTASGCEARRARLWDRVSDDVEWLLIADPRHVNYLCGFWINPLSFSAGERSLLLLQREGPVTLLADNFARRSAVADPFVTAEIIQPWYDHKNSVYNRDTALVETLEPVTPILRGAPGLLERAAVSLAVVDQVQPHDTGSDSLGTLLRSLRRCKDDDEIDLLRTCMRAGEAGHARAFEVIAPGRTDFEIYCEVQQAAQQAAGVPVQVYGDFRATSPKQPKAGGLPSGELLQEGELFILDYSVVIHGYRSDFTNTLAVGETSAEQRELFSACVAALEHGQGQVHSRLAAHEVFDAVSEVLDRNGFGPLKHHAGHGLGLGHPEPPILTPDSDDLLLAGNVITIEPGAYVEGIGGVRVEHNYLVTETGCEQLSDHKIALR